MNTPFDHRQIRRAFSRSAASYDAAAALQREYQIGRKPMVGEPFGGIDPKYDLTVPISKTIDKVL